MVDSDLAVIRRAVGAYGERVAAAHLVGSGMVVLDRNWRCRYGEIDVVALDGDVIVVCEVKTRRGTAYGWPGESVTPLKTARLRRLAGLWLACHPDVSQRTRDLRIDVVCVVRPRRGAALVEHLIGVA